MKRVKVFVSFILTCCMVLSMLPSETLASEVKDAFSSSTSEVYAPESKESGASEEKGDASPDKSASPAEGVEAEEAIVSEETENSEENGNASSEESVSLADDAELSDVFTLEESHVRDEALTSVGIIGYEGDDIPKVASYEPSDSAVTSNQSALLQDSDTSGENARYCVLVLDTSASTSFEESGRVFYTADTAIEYVKASAKKFVNDIRKVSGVNYVALVEYKGDTVNTVSDFTTDYDALNQAIDALNSSENVRSITYGLQRVNSLLDSISAPDAIKNVVLFTTGMTNAGPYSYDGKYDENTVGSSWRRMDTQVRLYAYSNSAVAETETIKSKATLYTVGLFQTMEDMPDAGRSVVTFFKLFAKDMATSDSHFYDVDDPSKLEFAFGEIVEDITKTSGKFKYAGQINQKVDQEATYYYDDAYFFKDANLYDTSLSTMSLCLELSTWSSSSANEAYQASGKKDDKNSDKWYDSSLSESNPEFWQDTLVNVKTLLLGNPAAGLGYEGIGFHDFAANTDWQSLPTKDSIGVVAARKQISAGEGEKEYTLVALVVRGGGYGSEWASNFTLGRSGEHEGFQKAKEDVLAFLRSYVSTLREDEPNDLKLWVVGFSRGGITANMVTGELNKNSSTLLPNTVSLLRSDTYCYVFEPPMGIMREQDDGSHLNIHNVVNQSDLVPLVAPEAWDFTRYNEGYDWPLPVSIANEEWDKQFGDMKTELEKLGYDPDFYYTIRDSYDLNQFNVDLSAWLPFGDPLWWNETESRVTRDVLNSGVTVLLDDFFQGRTYYTTNVEHGVRQIIGIIMYYSGALDGMDSYIAEVGSEPFDFDEFMDNLADLFTWDSIKYILKPAVALNFDSPTKRIDKVKERATQKVMAVFGGIGGEIGEMDIFAHALGDGFGNLCAAFASELIHSNTQSLNNCMNLIEALDLGTAIKNALSKEDREYPPNRVFCAHYPEICLAWVRSQDSNFNPNANNDKPVSSITRIIHINCPVDAIVYDSDGQPVASIVNDVPQDHGTSIFSTVSLEGEKIFYLPGDGEYRIEVSATDSGSVCYSVSEYNLLRNKTTRARYYLEIPVSEGDTFTGEVPKITDDELELNSETGSSVAYRLIDEENVEIPVSSDAVPETTYEVIVEKQSVDGMAVEGEIIGGVVTGAGTFLENDFAKIMAQPFPGSEFHGFTINGVEVDDVAEETHSETVWYVTRFRVASDTTVVAKFEDITLHTLSFQSGVGGEVTNEDGYFGSGMTVHLQATPHENYTFEGWEASNGATIPNAANAETEFVMPDDDVVITASFSLDTSAGFAITFDPNGGTLTGSNTMQTGTDGKLTSLPGNPTRSGSYSFTGWYTALSGGVQVTLDYVFTSDATVYAHWNYSGGGGGGGGRTANYRITLPTNLTGGKITSSSSTARSGATITLTVTPDDNYELDTLTVKNPSNNTQITLTGKGSGQYTFSMPANNVTVEVSFKAKPDSTSEPDDSDNQGENIDPTPQPMPWINPFTDVFEGTYYYDAVRWAVENGVTNGRTSTTFEPGTTCTRAHAVTFLWRAAGSPKPTADDNPFTDVNPTAYYYDAVLWAVEQGITNGRTPTTFEPGSICNRGQIVTFLYRYAKPAVNGNNNSFTDVVTGAYYYNAVNWAAEIGVTQGLTNTIFGPRQNCTRGQIVTFLYRYFTER